MPQDTRPVPRGFLDVRRVSAAPDGGILDVDDVRLRYRIDGSGERPWLVLCNSLMTDLTLWEQQVDVFAESFRVLRYDQRGHGGSSVPSADCTFPRLVDDLKALLDHLAIGSACVAGVSMGGVTALGLSARHPERVARVAVCDCQSRSTAAGAVAWDERIAVAEAGGMAALVEPTIGRWFTPPTVAENGAGVSAVRRMIGATPIEGFVRAARALQDYDFASYPAALTCPVLFLVGETDAALPAAMRGMADAAANARYQVIPKAGHLPNIEQPHAFNVALAAFLAPVTHT